MTHAVSRTAATTSGRAGEAVLVVEGRVRVVGCPSSTTSAGDGQCHPDLIPSYPGTWELCLWRFPPGRHKGLVRIFSSSHHQSMSSVAGCYRLLQPVRLLCLTSSSLATMSTSSVVCFRASLRMAARSDILLKISGSQYVYLRHVAHLQ